MACTGSRNLSELSSSSVTLFFHWSKALSSHPYCHLLFSFFSPSSLSHLNAFLSSSSLFFFLSKLFSFMGGYLRKLLLSSLNFSSHPFLNNQLSLYTGLALLYCQCQPKCCSKVRQEISLEKILEKIQFLKQEGDGE